MEGTIGKSLSRSIRRRTLGLDIFIIKEMVTDWNFENLTLASDFCRFLADNFGTAHHSAKMEDTIGRASPDLSDAEHLVLISSLLRKWWQIEIFKIWLWLQIFVGFWLITLEPLTTVQKWRYHRKELLKIYQMQTIWSLYLHYYRNGGWLKFWQFENHVNNGESHDAS